MSLDEVVAHTATLDRATDLPLSVDLENGYGANRRVRRAPSRASPRPVRSGASIEDYDPEGRIYELRHAAERNRPPPPRRPPLTWGSGSR